MPYQIQKLIDICLDVFKQLMDILIGKFKGGNDAS